MTIATDIASVPVASIKVPEGRQRKDLGDLKGLEESIAAKGLINPIIITRQGELVAGERRLQAHRNLQLPHILVRYLEDLDPATRALIEFEENAKRKDLHWIDETQTILNLHRLLGEPTLEVFSSKIHLHSTSISNRLAVARELEAGNQRILACDSFESAIRVFRRERDRVLDNELAYLEEKAEELFSPAEAKPKAEKSSEASSEAEPATPDAPTPPSQPALPPGILNEDFLSWAQSYSGRKFNFLHCDFPYGINYDKAQQGNVDAWGAYKDSPEIYWALVDCLIDHHQRFLSSSAHIMFWFSMKYYAETLERFRKAGFYVNPMPLIWWKTDNRGMLPDPERGPRQVYETAFLLSVGDRKIVKAVANCYGAPTGKTGGEAIHLSEKPEPMLRHFFQMFVDNLSEVLDPTCGSGSAIRAAEAMGAKRALGLELNPEYASLAQSALDKARRLRRAAGDGK